MQGAALKSIAQGNQWEFGGTICHLGAPPDFNIVKQHQEVAKGKKRKFNLTILQVCPYSSYCAEIYQLEVFSKLSSMLPWK